MTGPLLALLLGTWTLLLLAALSARPVVLALALVAATAFCRLERPVGGSSSAPGWALAASLVLVVAGVNLPVLGGDFLGDDYGYVQLFERKSLASFLRLGDISEGIWGHPLDELRPVFALSYKLGLLLHGPSARGFHADNLAVHVLNCLLVYALLRALEPRARLHALAAGLLFGLMPVHAEPLAWITGKVDSLPTAFYLGTLVLYVRCRRGAGQGAYAAALGVFALGLLSKEILITLPAVLVAYELLLGRPWEPRRQLARILPFALLTAGFLAVRRSVFDTFAREGQASSLERLWQFAQLQPEKLRWVLLPFERGTALELLTAGLVLGALAGAAALLVARRSEHGRCAEQAAFLGLGLYGFTLLPLLVTYSSMRHMYLPSAGIAGAVALLLFPVPDRGPRPPGRLALAAAALLCLASGLQLRAAISRYTDAGLAAREARTQLEERLRPLPQGTTLVLTGLPASDGPLLILKFGLPFALQPPFAPRDAYSPYRVIETPDVYCCPPRRWWQDKRGFVEDLLTGAPEQPVPLALAHWNERRREIVVREGWPLRSLVRRLVERALGAPLDQLSEPDAVSARRLVAALAECVRVSAGEGGIPGP